LIGALVGWLMSLFFLCYFSSFSFLSKKNMTFGTVVLADASSRQHGSMAKNLLTSPRVGSDVIHSLINSYPWIQLSGFQF
jgi:hypothetical protein